MALGLFRLTAGPNSASLADAYTSPLRARRGAAKRGLLIWLNAVNGRTTPPASDLQYFLLYIKPHGQRGIIEVTTVDQADMRALASHKTVVRHGAASL